MTYVSGSVSPVLVRMEVAPTTGSTTTMVSPFDHVFFTNNATVAAQTLVLPAKPQDGDRVLVSNASQITSFTVTDAASGSVLGAPTELLAGQGCLLMYSATQAAWFCASS